ncbi:MAG TPA: M28 family peptidase [Chitinophagaceae bacterium]|nr:M28 family peptidase [Chitinophagaceae bacterium]
MKKTTLLLIGCLSLLIVDAQKKNKTWEKIGNSITAADLKKHLYIVASAENGGRDTPSPGLEKAADYIEDHFRSLGLKPGNGDSYRMFYPLYRDSVLSSSVRVNGTSYELNADYQTGNGNYSAELPFSEAIFAGYGIVDDKLDSYKDLDVRGKAVIILEGAPADFKPSQSGFQNPSGTFGKLNAASKRGAVAVLIVLKDFPRRASVTQSNWNLNGYRATFNPQLFYISKNIAENIMGEDGKGVFDKMVANSLKGKTYKANIDLSFRKTTLTTQVSNVMGLLEGSDKKDEYVFITAHYDHVGRRDTLIFYGADDDGSGTVSILELAEAFAKAKAGGKGPRRSIVFMTVSGEEHGLWGSAYYTNHPVYPLEKTTVDLNIDMIGRIGNDYMKDKDSINYVYVIGDNKLSSELTPITDNINRTYTRLKLDRKYNDPKDPNRFYYRSDHYNFAEKGVPIIFYFNGVHPDYHRPTDTPDKIKYDLLEKRAKLVFYTAMEIANREEMLKRDIPLDSQRAF